MELLIPGLILVALMVYASTRIKRSAAAAFESETVETDDYVIQKPEGFLNVIGGSSRYAFEAYSKEFGTGDAEKFRQGTATLAIGPIASVSGEKVVSQRTEVIGNYRYGIVEADRDEAGVRFTVLRRSADKAGTKYVFEVVRLAETSDEFGRKTKEFADSFRLK
jgi:hypothetical protein